MDYWTAFSDGILPVCVLKYLSNNVRLRLLEIVLRTFGLRLQVQGFFSAFSCQATFKFNDMAFYQDEQESAVHAELQLMTPRKGSHPKVMCCHVGLVCRVVMQGVGTLKLQVLYHLQMLVACEWPTDFYLPCWILMCKKLLLSPARGITVRCVFEF